MTNTKGVWGEERERPNKKKWDEIGTTSITLEGRQKQHKWMKVVRDSEQDSRKEA